MTTFAPSHLIIVNIRIHASTLLCVASPYELQREFIQPGDHCHAPAPHLLLSHCTTVRIYRSLIVRALHIIIPIAMSLTSPNIISPYFYRSKHEQPPDCRVPPPANSDTRPQTPPSFSENQPRQLDQDASLSVDGTGRRNSRGEAHPRAVLDYLYERTSEENLRSLGWSRESGSPMPETLAEYLAGPFEVSGSEDEDSGIDESSCSCSTTDSSWSSKSDDHHQPLFAKRRKTISQPSQSINAEFEFGYQNQPAFTGFGDGSGNECRRPCRHRRCRRLALETDEIHQEGHVGIQDEPSAIGSNDRNRRGNSSRYSSSVEAPGKSRRNRLPDTIIEGTPPPGQEGLIRAPSGQGTIVYVPTAFKKLYVTLGVTSFKQLTKNGHPRRFSKKKMAALGYVDEKIRKVMNFVRKYRRPPRSASRANDCGDIPVMSDVCGSP